MVLRLHQQTWQNPFPDDQISAVDFDSAMANSAPASLRDINISLREFSLA